MTTLQKTVFGLCSTLLLCWPVQAQDWRPGHRPHEWQRRARPVDARHVWVHSLGSFTDQGNGRWVEQSNTGTYNFTEVARTPDYIELYDASRGARARLYNNAMYSLAAGASDWGLSYNGQWQQ
jgi:hypothetical protein